MIFEPTVTLSGIASIGAIISVGYAIISGQRKTRRENEADGRARTDELKEEFRSGQVTLGERITALETRSAQHEKDFMPRPEIMAAVDHEKTNRIAADQQMTRMIETNTRDIVDIKVQAGRIEQKQDGMSGDVVEIKNTLRAFEAKLDKVLDGIRVPQRRLND